MHTDSGSRIGFKPIAAAVFAVALLGAVTMPAVAEDAGANGPRGDKAHAGETKAKAFVLPGTHQHRHVRPLSASRASGHTIRNAIGVVVPEHKGVERPDAEHFQSVAVPHGPNPPGKVSDVPAHVAPTGAPLARPAYRPNAVIGGPSGGTTGGTGLVRRRPSVSAIGGPATATAGISGTAIRTKP
jgi:hypothetical protein